MAIQVLKDYRLGDMIARYLADEGREQVGFVLLPADLPAPSCPPKEEQIDSLVQIKLAGDTYDAAYAMGNTMRNGESVRRLKYCEQRVLGMEKAGRAERMEEAGKAEGNEGIGRVEGIGGIESADTLARAQDTLEIHTILEAEAQYRVRHILTWKKGAPYVRIRCQIENTGAEAIRLEMLESFSLGSLSPYLEGDGHGQMLLHRLRSVWSQEGRLETIPLEDLQLEPAWDPHAVRCEKFGQAGSMPVNKFFPFAAVEDRQSGVFWGAQLACPASWQMELYRKDDALALSGGLADRDFGHWMKDLHPGESFLTPEAIASTAHTPSIDVFTARLTQAALEHLAHVPEPEQSLPIIFNEYCTTWGNPSHANICEILEAIQGKGFQYFVIDCGWYKEDGVPWDISMGDYEPSPTLFPQGLDKTTAKIREAGMIPGIWFEIETVGKAARAYQLEPHLLHKDGKPLTSYFRRFWDMRDPWVEGYLTQKVIGTLQKYGFGYLKIDYNETIGIGCDGAESLGEALRQNMEASQAFFEKIKQEVPGIVLENCASGGHRLEPGLMSQMSMASFSDAHECPEIPIIAANLHRAIHPAQSQIWAVIRQTDSQQRIAYSIANTFLGRMCISGDVTDLSQAQWDVIEHGMEFYRKIAPIIKQGQSYRFGSRIKSARHPEGWQALLRIGQSQEAYMVIHTFANAALPLEIQIQLPEGCPAKVLEIYSDTQEQIEIQDGILSYQATHSWKAVAVRLNA